MRYKLIEIHDDGESEVGGQRKSTKKQVDEWCETNIQAMGLDWRVGYMIKFKGYDTVYDWRWIKDNKRVSCWR